MSESVRSGLRPRSLFDPLGAELPLFVLTESSPFLPLNVVLSRQITPVFLSPLKEKLPIAVLYLLTLRSATATLSIQSLLSAAWF